MVENEKWEYFFGSPPDYVNERAENLEGAVGVAIDKDHIVWWDIEGMDTCCDRYMKLIALIPSLIKMTGLGLALAMMTLDPANTDRMTDREISVAGMLADVALSSGDFLIKEINERGVDYLLTES